MTVTMCLRNVPRGRPVRPPDRAKQGDLQKGPVYSPMLYRNYIDQQISPCFLQDLQSKWEKEQMQKKYECVKSEKRCEVVTVGRRAARGGESQPYGRPVCDTDSQCVMPAKRAQMCVKHV